MSTVGSAELATESDARRSAAIGAIIDRLFVLSRTVTVHGEGHPLSLQLSESVVSAMAATEPPFALQFVGQAVFVDRVLVVLEPQTFMRSLRLSRWLSAMHVHELSVDETPTPRAVLSLGAAIARRATTAPVIAGIATREIANATAGVDGSVVDPELFATAQMTRALADVETLEARMPEGWSWPGAVRVLRRVERALDADLGACLRFLDLAPGETTVARRALGALVHTTAMLAAVKVSAASRRAGAHVSLALALHGYAERDGCTFAESADTALGGLLALGAGAVLDAHRSRVCALVHGVCAHFEDRSKWHPVARAAALGFEIEKLRCPLGPEFVLENVDLLAWAVSAVDQHDLRWVRALLAVHGTLPVGAKVKLGDGRTGVSLGGAPETEPFRPLVYLSSGTIVWPESAVDIALGDE